ncbi:helix-turn-helix transcriptional regulator [Paenarthrobacter sp. Z7-10]|nr:helix-turn-helix transcriptional regulator [Paenarthrobacter sp. Z7-10]
MPATLGTPASSGSPGARERIMAAAYDLFSRRGIRDVGINELVSRAGVAKATFYAHFPSKDNLVLAFLERCHQVFTVEQIILQSVTRRCG